MFRIRVKGLISSPVPIAGSSSVQRSGRTSTDRQFFYVNGRPCTLTKVSSRHLSSLAATNIIIIQVQKVVNETYKSYTASNSSIPHFPFIVADFNVPGDAVDVNVTPDKRTILVHAEVQVLDALKVPITCETSYSKALTSIFRLRSRNCSLRRVQRTMLIALFEAVR
jgi:DNA mismatch repair protein PMS2